MSYYPILDHAPQGPRRRRGLAALDPPARRVQERARYRIRNVTFTSKYHACRSTPPLGCASAGPRGKLSDDRRGESSAAIRGRVEAARERQTKRFAGTKLTCNADTCTARKCRCGPTQIKDYCPIDETARQLLGTRAMRADAAQRAGLPPHPQAGADDCGSGGGGADRDGAYRGGDPVPAEEAGVTNDWSGWRAKGCGSCGSAHTAPSSNAPAWKRGSRSTSYTRRPAEPPKRRGRKPGGWWQRIRKPRARDT